MIIAIKEFINKIFNKIKWDLCSLLTDCKHNNSQVASSRINEVHCGILKTLKRPRNKYGVTDLAKAVAFTLAETLVVMGIIGVVAALTIPNLNQSTGDREKVAKLKKVYANLTDAFGRATAVYGPIDEWFINDGNNNIMWHDRLAGRMTEFMKISKNCGNSDEGCFPTEDYKTLDDDTTDTPYGWDEPKFLLADGTALDFYISTKDCSINVGDLQDICGFIYVDIDGIKGSNTEGKDFFTFYVTKSGIYPMGARLADAVGNILSGCFETGSSCTGWVIETGNMDYLKASNGKCPNGTTLSWENTSCK